MFHVVILCQFLLAASNTHNELFSKVFSFVSGAAFVYLMMCIGEVMNSRKVSVNE